MRAALVRIGNSRGIRIPRPLIEQCRLRDPVDLRVENDCLVVSAKHQPRQGWAEAFRAAGRATGDELLLASVGSNNFDRREWRW